MEAQGAAQDFEFVLRHDDERRKRTAAGSLAIATMTMQHRERFGGRFVVDGAASAASGKRCFHKVDRCLVVQVSFNFTCRKRSIHCRFRGTSSCWTAPSASPGKLFRPCSSLS